MKKILKVLVAVLVTALIVAFAAVSAVAAEPVSISIKTPPTKTVYYEGVDTLDGTLYFDLTGTVITVTDSDGNTFDTPLEFTFGYISNYVIGENDVNVFYEDEEGNQIKTTLKITVKENPVDSVKITKMPTKTEYDMDKDVLTKENFSFDRIYAADPEMFDEIMADSDVTYEEVKAYYDEYPAELELLKEMLFDEYSSLLLADTTGMEIEVTFKDGTKQTLTDEQDCVVYEGTEIPVMVDQYNDVAEGKNTLYVDVAGVTADFDVTVKKSAPADKPAADKPAADKPAADKPAASKPAATNNKNPEIPNTDGGVSLALAGVLALVSGCGIALVPSKKKEQF